MKQNTLRYSLLLLLTAAIWGFAFVAQSVGMDYVQPFTFTAARSLIGGIVLLPFIFIRAQKAKAGLTFEEKSASWKQALPGGMRTVSFMYDWRFLSSATGRSVYTLLRADVFPADSRRGSLCTDCG